MRSERTYFVYMLMSRTGTLYTGVSNNLEVRLVSHRLGTGSKFTARYGVTRLVWYETTSDVLAAIEREKQIKGWTRAKKIALIKSVNPDLKDLSADWT